MKNTKRLFTLMLVLVLAVACVFTVSSCKDKDKDGDGHKHSYTAQVTQPTCEAQGYTTYTCSCGHTYKDNYTPTTHNMTYHAPKAATCTETGHNGYVGCDVCGKKQGEYVEIPKTAHTYVSEITKYPSATENGSKNVKCSVCGEGHAEKIDAFTASLPDVSAAIASMIKEGTYTLGATKGSNIALVRELSDYTNANGDKMFIAFKVAEAQLSSDGIAAKGYLKLEFGTAAKLLDGSVPSGEVEMPATFDNAGALEIYLNGNDVSISVEFDGVTTFEDELTVNEVFFSAIAEALGMEFEELVTAIYLSDRAGELTDTVMALISALDKIELPEADTDSLTDLGALLSLVAGNIVKASTELDGSTVYTLNVNALKEISDALDSSATLGDLLNKLYGADTTKSIMAIAVSIPDLTVMDLMNRVVSFASLAGVEIEKAYELIDMYIYLTSGYEFSIQAEIAKNYNKTVAGIVAENIVASNPGADYDQAVMLFKNAVNNVVYTVTNLSIDAALSIYLGYEISITEELADFIDLLDEATEVHVIFDAEGNLSKIEATIDEFDLNVQIGANAISIVMINAANKVEASITDETVTVSFFSGADLIAEMQFGYEASSENEVTTEIYSLLFTVAGEKMLDGAVTLEDGIFKLANAIAYTYEYEDEDGNEYAEPKVTETVISVSYDFSGDVHNVIVLLDGTAINVSVSEIPDNSGIIITVTENKTVILNAGVHYTSETENEVTTETYEIFVKEGDVTLLNGILTFENGTFKDLSFKADGYEPTEPETDDNILNTEPEANGGSVDTEPIEATEETTEEKKVVTLADIKVTYVYDEKTLLHTVTVYDAVTKLTFALSEDPNNEGVAFSVEQNGKVLAILTAVHETIVSDGVTTEKYSIIIADSENILIDTGVTLTDGVFGDFNLVVNGYTFDENDTDDPNAEPESEKVLYNILDLEAAYTEKDGVSTYTYVLNDTITATLTVVNKAGEKSFSFISKYGEDVYWDIKASKITTGTTEKFVFDVSYAGEVFTDIDATVTDGKLTAGSLILGGFVTHTEDVIDPETGDVIGTDEYLKHEILLDLTLATNDGVITLYDKLSDTTGVVEVLENGIKITADDILILVTLDRTFDAEILTGIDFVAKITQGKNIILDTSLSITPDGIIADGTVDENKYEVALTTTETESESKITSYIKLNEMNLFAYEASVGIDNGAYTSSLFLELLGEVYYDWTYKVIYTENGVRLVYDVDRFVIPTPLFNTIGGSNGDNDFEYGGENSDEPLDGPLVPLDNEEYEQEIIDFSGSGNEIGKLEFFFDEETGKYYFFNANGEKVYAQEIEHEIIEYTFAIEGEGEFYITFVLAE
ncbi:MAG: hypothetical protein E7673_02420 [Ruminococcaceae bacterium]|nr:hypothetical protein [Oscillospiraceae bacterium]